MNAKAKRRIRSGGEFDRYFQPSPLKMRVVNKWATTENTVALCLTVAAQSAPSVAELADTFRRPTLKGTCQALWEWIYAHIAYEKDDVGHEQIRNPSRSWHDRQRGVDCDDYSVFIGACLTALAIPFQLRVTAYQGGWQHIYVVVPKNGEVGARLDQARRGEYIVIDDVTDQYDYEVSYTKKFDTPMQLEALSGTPDYRRPTAGPPPRPIPMPTGEHYVDGLGNIYVPVRASAGRLSGLSGLDPNRTYYHDGMGGIFDWIGNAVKDAGDWVGGAVKTAVKAVGQAGEWVGTGIKTVVTTPIRLGILAYMKLNWGDKAGQLRWAYIPFNDFVAKYIGKEHHRVIVSAAGALRAKFTGMGGDANTLRMAILTGEGNSDRLVPSTSDDLQGLGMLLSTDPDWLAIKNVTSPQSLIFIPNAGMNGLGALPAAAAAIAAALPIINQVLKALNDFTGKGDDTADSAPSGELVVEQGGMSDEEYANSFVATSLQTGTKKTLTPLPGITSNTGLISSDVLARLTAGMKMNQTTAVDVSGNKITPEKLIELVSQGAKLITLASGVVRVVRQDVKAGNNGSVVDENGAYVPQIIQGDKEGGTYATYNTPTPPAASDSNTNALLIGGGIALAALFMLTNRSAPSAPAPAALAGLKKGQTKKRSKRAYKVVELT